jgi:hypothetical protein
MSGLVDLLTTAIWSELGDKLHTCIPAVVSSYNKADCTVEAAPLIDKVFNDGTVIRFQPIVQIPVIFPRTKRFKMSYPLEAGDGVLLLFAERCIDEWVLNGDYSTPDNPRIFKMTDAIAIPGLFGIKVGKPIISDKEFELEFDDVKMTSDGKKFFFTGDIEVTGNVKVTGDIEATGGLKVSDNVQCSDVNVGAFTLKQHTHATAATGPPSLPVAFPIPPVPEV